MRRLSGSVTTLALLVFSVSPALEQSRRTFKRVPFESTAPIGSIVAYGGDLAAKPDNWLLCDGTVLRTSAYPELARIIGSRWGGTTAADFRVPDLMGRFLRGVDSTKGRDPD